MGNSKIRNIQCKWRYVVVGMIFLMVLCVGGFYTYQRSIYTGIPDLSSTFDSGGNYYMSVVSNSREILDKEAFAEQIVRMSRNNSFQSMKFSVDANGYPQSLDVSVYCSEKEIGKQDAVFHFVYEPNEKNTGYDIYHNTDKYKLRIL